LPGLLTSIGGVIIAITGLLTVLYQMRCFGNREPQRVDALSQKLVGEPWHGTLGDQPETLQFTERDGKLFAAYERRGLSNEMLVEPKGGEIRFWDGTGRWVLRFSGASLEGRIEDSSGNPRVGLKFSRP